MSKLAERLSRTLPIDGVRDRSLGLISVNYLKGRAVQTLWKLLCVLFLSVGGMTFVAGCEQDAGDELEDAADQVEDTAEDAADEVEDAVD